MVHLQDELDQARAEAKESADPFRKERESREAAQARITIAEEELTKCVIECDTLNTAKDVDAAEIKKLGQDVKRVEFHAKSVREELRQASEVVAGMPYLM